MQKRKEGTPHKGWKAAARKTTLKKPGAYKCRRYGILNPYGDVWTPDTFNTMLGAEQHVRDFWAKQPDHDLSKYKVVVVNVTVSPVP